MKLNYKTCENFILFFKNSSLYKTLEEMRRKRVSKYIKKTIDKKIRKCERFLNTNKEANKAIQEIETNNKFWEGIKNPKFFETDEEYKKLIGNNLPWIYVFIMDIIDGYVKIGYTFAKTPDERVDEWRKVYKEANLHLIAKFPASFVCDGIRLCIHDTDVHNFVEAAGHIRGDRTIFEGKGHYSEEFFKNQNIDGTEELFNFNLDGDKSWKEIFSYDNIDEHVKIDIFEDIMEKIYSILKDTNKSFIQKKAELPHLKKYGDLLTTKGEEAKILRWPFTDEQIEIIENGVKSLGVGNTELLLAAIMRFGKSAVSYQIMLKYFKPSEFHGGCHLIVSGKDTRETWQKDFFHEDIVEKIKENYDKGTVFMWYEDQTIHWCGNIKDEYGYHEVYRLSGQETKPQHEITKEIFDEICKDNVVFFYVSFQDIYGEKEDGQTVYKIKEKHEIIFDTCFDGIIVDETHFGARSKVFGAVLDGEDNITIDEGDVKPIKCKTHLHLSATPYKILASNEFKEEKHDIIGVISLSDIYHFKEEWSKKHPHSDEWENPYFGTPQFHALLLSFPEEIMKKIGGNNGSFFSELFSSKNNEDNKPSLKHRKEVIKVFSYLFGDRKDFHNGLIRNNTVSENNVMKHIVIALPNRKACEMVYDLFQERCIPGMDEYDVHMLSGITPSKLIKSENDLNNRLWESEHSGRKSITVTCDKYTTGSTINLWDTMLYFKDGDSAEYYDQTWGRILSRAVVDILDENNNPTGEKVCIKNHVYFIDFKPNRAVEMRYNYTTQMKDYFLSLGTEEGKEHAYQMQNGFRYYHMCRLDDFTEINDFDSLTREWQKTFENDSHGNNYQVNKLCDTFMSIDLVKSCNLSLFGGSKTGGIVVRTKRNGGSETGEPIIEEYLDGESTGSGAPYDTDSRMGDKQKNDRKERATIKEIINGISNLAIGCTERVTNSEELLNAVTGNRYEFYKDLYHFSDIIKVLKASCDPNSNFTIIARTSLNNLINEKNSLINDEVRYPDCVERAAKFMESIRNISNNECLTPRETASYMNDLLLHNIGHSNPKILDAWGYGEFTIDLYKKVGYEFVKTFVYTAPSSVGARIFVEKIYDILGLDKNHILNDNDIDDNDMHFDGLVGNPPYQGVGKNQIYPKYFLKAKELDVDTVCLIFPRNWQKPVGGNGLKCLNNKETKEDRQIVLIDNRDDVFVNVSGAKETNIVLWKRGFDNGLDGKQNIYKEGVFSGIERLMYEKEEKVKDEIVCQLGNVVKNSDSFNPVQNITLEYNPYGLRTDTAKLSNDKIKEKYGLEPLSQERSKESDIKIFTDYNSAKYAPENYPLKKNKDTVNKFKVAYCKTWGNGELGSSYSKILILRPGEICTEKFMISGVFDTEEEAKNHAKLLITPFALSLLYLEKDGISTNKVWGYVPLQTYSEEWWNGTESDFSDYENNEIMYISHQLFVKYGAQEFEEYVNKSVKHKTIEDSILYYA